MFRILLHNYLSTLVDSLNKAFGFLSLNEEDCLVGRAGFEPATYRL